MHHSLRGYNTLRPSDLIPFRTEFFKLNIYSIAAVNRFKLWNFGKSNFIVDPPYSSWRTIAVELRTLDPGYMRDRFASGMISLKFVRVDEMKYIYLSKNHVATPDHIYNNIIMMRFSHIFFRYTKP